MTDQNLGRFLGVDPIIENPGSQALNPYSYLQNNPLSGTDPSGYAKASEECAGAGRTGCVNDKELKASKAATKTGSHIAAVNTNITTIYVNPSEGGMAELQVAEAGMKSGYVVQAAPIEASAGRLAADQLGASFRQVRPSDRPGTNSTPSNESPYKLPMYEGGNTVMQHADRDLLAAGMYAGAFSSDETIAKKWADIVYPLAMLYGVEVGATIARTDKRTFYLGMAYSDGRSRDVSGLIPESRGAWRGKLSATIHTHPNTSQFSGTTSIAAWGDESARLRGNDDAGDLVTSYRYRLDAFVVGPGSEISGWRYHNFVKHQASTSAGWSELGASTYQVRGPLK